MTFWIIEPRDPLIVRDGRPFGPNPGARAATLPFPFPSTIAGALRSRAGLGADGAFDTTAANIAHVKTITIHGPLLARLRDDGDEIDSLLLPAPADALVLRVAQAGSESRQIALRCLAPREDLAGASNMPRGLLPIGPQRREKQKISDEAPRFWHQNAFAAWLNNPADDDQCVLETLGTSGLATDPRTHVSVAPATLTAREGALFQTQGLVFTLRNQDLARRGQFDCSRLALVAEADDPFTHFVGGISPLGGERRLMRWVKRSSGTLSQHLPWPTGLRQRIIEERCCRVLLLTPAIFSADHDSNGAAIGYRPPLAWSRGGVTAQLVAAAVPRPLTVSGWDFEIGKPKKTRRLAPAGSVYFVTFAEGADVGAWLDQTWMQNVSDGQQDQRDGFGLAVVGAWPKQRVKEND